MMELKQVGSIDEEKDLIIPFFGGEVSSKRIQSVLGHSNIDFTGGFKKYEQYFNDKGKKVYFLGLGEAKHRNRINEAFRNIFHNEQKKWTSIQIDASELSKEDVKDAVLGISMSMYDIGRFKTVKEDLQLTQIEIVSSDQISDEIFEGKMTGASVNSIKTLVDAPPNIKTPANLAKWAMKSAAKHNYECKIWDENALKKEGFGAITAVGQGSQHPPRMIMCSYLPKVGESVDIALVGKGITFDTGGLSIKGSTNLHYMKSDMGGAAAVLGAVELAAKLELKVNVIGVVGSAENAVDGASYLPGDVINSYSGKTIEIIDTDAEGRLVLADALNYTIRNHKPKVLVDLATLTGSAVRTLGYSAGALFTQNDGLAAQISAIGDKIYERVWRLPMYDELEDHIHSDIADIRNFSMKPIAGASAAAKFLEFFTEEHERWVHLDIAGVAFGSNPYAKLKSASGYGVRLMVEFIKTFEK